jgi:hypothetical protein
MNYQIGTVYYNPRTALFTQYRGNGQWGAQCRYYNDAKTVTYNMPVKPWWVDLLAVPYPQESELMTTDKHGAWLCRAHRDTRRLSYDQRGWTSFVYV